MPDDRARTAVVRGPDAPCWSGGVRAAPDHAMDVWAARWEPTPAARLREETRDALACFPAAAVVTSAAGVRRWVEQAGSQRAGLVRALRRLRVVAHRPDAVEACAAAGVAATALSADCEAGLVRAVAAGATGAVILEAPQWEPQHDGALDVSGPVTRRVRAYRYLLPPDPGPCARLVHRLKAGAVDRVVFTSPSSVVGLFEVAAEMGSVSSLRAALFGEVVVAAVDRPTAAAAERHGAFVSRCPLRPDGRDLEAMLAPGPCRPLLPAAIGGGKDTVATGGGCLSLSPLEARLFAALNRRQGFVCPRPVLIAEVWGAGSGDDCLASLACRLRRRLAPLGLTVEAVPRRGYRLRAAGGA